MKAMPYIVATVLALAAGIGTLWGINASGVTEEGALANGLYASLVIYPAAVLAFAMVFWIVFAAMDPGSEH
jgi:hypothetical protein